MIASFPKYISTLPLIFSPSLFGTPTVKMYEKKVYLLEKAVIVKSLTKDFSAYVCAFYFLRHVRSLLNCSSNASAAFIPPSTPVSDVYPPPEILEKVKSPPPP